MSAGRSLRNAATLLLVVAASAQAQAPVSGAALAREGAPPAVPPCGSCHGAAGEGVAAAGFPRLAGQPAAYLSRQLDAYANDSRRNPVMQPIAKALTPTQRALVAGYYATLVPPPGTPAANTAAASASAAAAPATAASAAALASARRLAEIGDDARLLQACANCHGPQGTGEAPYPYLAGQHASYLSAALDEWKSGARNTDPSGQMQRIAKLLQPAEASALAAWFASLPAPPPVQSMASMQPSGRGEASSRVRTVVSGPTRSAAGAPTQGVGTEQGAPLSGGTQGVGGPGAPTGPRSGAPGGGGNGALGSGANGGSAAGASSPRR